MPAPTPKGQVGGHEGCGRVVKLGLGVTNLKVGDRVGIKYIASACLDCGLLFSGGMDKVNMSRELPFGERFRMSSDCSVWVFCSGNVPAVRL